MEYVSGQMELFHILWLICVTGMILCLLFSVILFIRMDIKGVIGYVTGRSARCGIRAIEQSGEEDRKKRTLMSLPPETFEISDRDETEILYLKKQEL